MEKLQRELDGHCRTQSGFCAVVPRISSGITPDKKSKFLDFKASMLSETIRVEWPAESPVALFENDVAVNMVNRGYAKDLSDEQLAEYNELVGEKTDTQTNFPPEGWTKHPSAEGFYYKGSEVLSEADLRAKTEAAK